MDYSKLIHEYLDGELNTPLEDALFAGLSANNELRTEFSQQIKLHIVAQNDMGTISPPVKSTNKIFSSLGFSIPTGDFLKRIAPSAEPVKKYGPLALFFRKHLATIATAIISIAITSLVYTVFINEDATKTNIAQREINSKIPITQSFDANNYYFSYDNSSSNSDNSIKNNPVNLQSSLKHNTIRNTNYSKSNNLAHNTQQRTNNQFKIQSLNSEQNNISNENKAGLNLALSKINIFNNNHSLIKNYNKANTDNSINLPYNDIGNNIIQSNKSYPFFFPSDASNIISNTDNTKFSLQVRGFQYSAPTSELKAKGEPFFKNMSISAFYKFNSEYSLGLEFGQEQFAQKFMSTSSGQAFEYEQNPLFFWYGASFHWTANDLNIANIIFPYSQVFAGLSNDAVSGKIVGPLGRAQVGLQLKPINNITFSFGIEGAMLLYSVHNQILTSDKLGLTYGISLSY